MPIWAYDWEGRTVEVEGRKLNIVKQLTEVTDHVFGQRHAFTLARLLSDDSRYFLKIRYDLNPKNFPLIEDVEENKKESDRHACFEMDLIQLLHQNGYGPRLVQGSAYTQNESQPYPGGRIFYIVSGYVHGQDVDKIKKTLSYGLRQNIQLQLTQILRLMGQHDRILREQDPSCLRYDISNKKLYLVDVTHWGYMVIQDDEITRHSEFVTAFDILSQRELDAEASGAARAAVIAAEVEAQVAASNARAQQRASRENPVYQRRPGGSYPTTNTDSDDKKDY